jgi:hypothetical protein
MPEKSADTFCMEDIPYNGHVPCGDASNHKYAIFRNVRDHGAKAMLKLMI